MKLPDYNAVEKLMKENGVKACKIFGSAAGQKFPTRAHLHVLVIPGQGCDFVHKERFEKRLRDLLADELELIEIYTDDALIGMYEENNKPKEEAQKIIDGAISIDQWLLEKKNELITKENYPLHYAAKTNNIEEIERILENDSHIINTIIPQTQQTALHIAAEYGSYQAIHWLINHEADMSAKNVDGNTAYEVAKQANHTQIASLLQDQGARAQQKNSQGQIIASKNKGENGNGHTPPIPHVKPTPMEPMERRALEIKR